MTIKSRMNKPGCSPRTTMLSISRDKKKRKKFKKRSSYRNERKQSKQRLFEVKMIKRNATSFSRSNKKTR